MSEQVASSSAPSPPSSRTAPRREAASSPRRVAAGVLAAVVVAVALDAVVSATAKAFGAPAGFKPLSLGAYGFLTVVGVLGATAGWVVVRRRARRPGPLLRALVPVVLVLSFIPDVAVLVTGAMGATAGGVAALVVMHVLVAAVAVTMLVRVLPVPMEGTAPA